MKEEEDSLGDSFVYVEDEDEEEEEDEDFLENEKHNLIIQTESENQLDQILTEKIKRNRLEEIKEMFTIVPEGSIKEILEKNGWSVV